jgi:hypothetical protein
MAIILYHDDRHRYADLRRVDLSAPASSTIEGHTRRTRAISPLRPAGGDSAPPSRL